MEQNGKSKPDLMTAQEVSNYLRLPITTVYELTTKGKLIGAKCGKQWRYLQADIANYLNRSRPSKFVYPATEKRRFPRLKTCIPAKVTGLLPETSELELSGIIHNLSEGGALFSYAGSKLEAGDPIRITFVIPDSDSHVVLDGRIVHQTNASKSGLKFKRASYKTREMIREYVG